MHIVAFKIIVSMKMCYVGVLGYREKYINFTGMFFIFWIKFAPKACFQSKTEKVKIVIEFCIFKLV